MNLKGGMGSEGSWREEKEGESDMILKALAGCLFVGL